ncbi:ABC transporter permease [Humibacter albus]|uniref:ABC transporter permease n=1 Tax=Humibacter albus TaxID=427754 RepID=UPI0003B5A58B|nr:ABC transporter permease [Humibacter albus]
MSLESGGPTVAETGAEEDDSLELDQIEATQRAEQPDEDGPRWSRALHDITGGSTIITVLAVVASLIVGAILIALTNPQVQAALGYFFARPSATFAAIGQVVGGAYSSLFQGGVYDFSQVSFVDGIQPLFTSLGFATPLIAAGLGIGIGFRAGVFNIGAQGQILVAGALAGWIGYTLPLPPGLHLIVAILGALLGGAVYAGIAGVLKASTGAHEVIVTIMLNYVAYYGLSFLLSNVLKAPGSNNPISPAEASSAVLPSLFGSPRALNLGLVIVIVLTVIAWWFMTRSSLGFRFRAVGENPKAALTAGISVKRTVIYTMLVSGAFVGFAGAYQVLAQTTTGFTNALDAGIGFNAITVALLGRNKPWGIFWAGILFGIFQAGGYTMQATQGIDVDIVQVLQSIIVLFIAAPPLVRALFRLPAPNSLRRARRVRHTTAPEEAIAR